MHQKPCIIFDMDGTLIDSSAAMTQSVNFVRASIGLEPITKNDLEYYINQPDQHLAKIFYNTTEYDPAHKALFKDHYLASSSRSISLYPYVREMLESLHQKATLNIATNASDFFATHMLEHLGILDFFTHVRGSNNVELPKPHPQMIEMIMRESSSAKVKTILVGDSIKDEMAAQRADVRFIFASWGYGTSETASLRARDIQELLRLLDSFI